MKIGLIWRVNNSKCSLVWAEYSYKWDGFDNSRYSFGYKGANFVNIQRDFIFIYNKGPIIFLSMDSFPESRTLVAILNAITGLG